MSPSLLVVLPVLLGMAMAAQPAAPEYNLTSWSESGRERQLPAGPPVTMKLMANGLVGGHAGVNRYTGSYTLSPDGSIAWQGAGFATTLMAGPVELMQFEQEFLKALRSATRIERDNSSLRLLTDGGDVVLTFTPAEKIVALNDLFGAEQQLTRFVSGGEEVALPSSAITLTLQREGRMTGAAAVNRYFAGYRLLGEEQISVTGPVGATRRAGPPELMQFDQRYFEALPSIRTIRVEDGLLVLEGPGVRLEFRAAEAVE